ncbi:Hypothetical protein TPAS_2934 [Trichococcus pasteurii]|uniref:Uncharacterized protein n=1 Tax=Trichococcus pasteurii TaxID=43064 RepID=A0A1W1IJN5_9LACT|nr:hypothetical protein SAMN04488086_1213 [Trichococcus pasteurii]SLM53207.1 Hypothetical protein TPAS_2934 [Trichococcus pasteurii]SSB94088.1 Hypothetical protein TPAS_2934 [Trichococcus pasteurii]
MNVYHAARTAGWSRHWSFGISRPTFSRHIAWALTVRYSSLLVQSTQRAGVGCSVFSALRSVDTSHGRRLFGILPLLVQSTHRTGVDCSAFVAPRSVNIPRGHRLFIQRDVISATLTSSSLIFSLQNLIHAICIFCSTPICQTLCCQLFIWKKDLEV